MLTQELLHTSEIIYLPVEKICPNPYQPRKAFERPQLEELAESIKKYGVMQPINVRLINGTSYELVSGERRLKASRLAGMATIPAIVITISDQESAILALVENLQRENLNYFEEAEGFGNLISNYALTQEEVARKVGKSQSTIANKLRILRLTEPVQRLLIENDLSERHARALLKLTSEAQQLEALKKVIANSLNVKKTEELVEIMVKSENSRGKKRQIIKPYIRDLRLFTNTIKQAVDLMNHSGVDTICDIENSVDGCFISIVVSY